MFNINNFISSINNDGVVRTNRFKVTFRLPNYLTGRIGGTGSILDFFGVDPSVSQVLIGGAADMIVGSGNIISLRCEGAQLPGITHATVDGMPRLGYGAIEEMPYAPIFDNMNLSFVLDRDSKIHKIFYDWSNSIVNYQAEGQSRFEDTRANDAYGRAAYEVGFKDDYVTDVQVDVYDTNDIRIMSATAFRAHPKGLPPVDLNWQSQNEIVRMTVPFAFTDFRVRYDRDLTQYGIPDDVSNLIDIANPLTRLNIPNPRSIFSRLVDNII